MAGTHGKTSTTSLLVVAAQACGADPSFAIGGNLYETGRNAHLGSGELAVVEADESDGSFLLTRPASALITNVEADHLENHGDLEGIFGAFEAFVDRVDPDGPGARLRRRPGARGGSATTPAPAVAGCTPTATRDDADEQVYDVVTTGGGVEFSVRGPLLGDRRVQVGRLIGQHMALNAAAALTLRRASRPRRGRGRRVPGPASPASTGASSPTARAAASGSSTTTPTTPPRSRPRSRRRGRRWPATGA